MSSIMDFEGMRKIARLSKEVIVTEKIDGTNGQIYIIEEPLVDPVPGEGVIHLSGGHMLVGSRTHWLKHEADNYGFWHWAYDHADELMKLGPGRHYGEWWGSKINRGYGLPSGQRNFSLFNTSKWSDDLARPVCCRVVPVLWAGPWDSLNVVDILVDMRYRGSRAQPGFMNPEGVVVFHTAAGVAFKKTIENDEKPKGETE